MEHSGAWGLSGRRRLGSHRGRCLVLMGIVLTCLSPSHPIGAQNAAPPPERVGEHGRTGADAVDPANTGDGGEDEHTGRDHHDGRLSEESHGDPEVDPEREAAIAHFRRGIELFEEGNYEAAAFEFEQAYTLRPNYRLLYNLGLAQQRLHDYVAASTSLRSFLDEGGDAVAPATREAVAEVLERLTQRIGHVRIEVSHEGALLALDGRPLGMSPLDGPVPANIGHHLLTATREGAVARASVDVRAGVTSHVRLRLPQTPASPPTAPEATPATSATAPQRAARAMLGTSLALAAASGVTGGLALRADDDLDERLAQMPADVAASERTRDRLRRRAIATDVLMVGAVLCAAVGLVLYLARRRRAPSPRVSLALGD